MSVFMSRNRVCSVSITDRQMLTPTLAKVIIAWTGEPTGEDVRAEITAGLNYMGSIVEHSFRQLTDESAVGFIRYQPAIQPWNEQEVKASFKVMGSNANIMMDTRDRTLWQVQDGPGGRFLARHGNDNLAELIEAQLNHDRMSVPKLNRVTMAKAAPGEFASFVTPNGDMDHGFVTHVNDTRCKVISASTSEAVIVDYSAIASLAQVPVPAEHHAVIASEMTRQQKSDASSYWKELYKLWEQTGVNDGGLARTYTDDLVHQVNSNSPLGGAL